METIGKILWWDARDGNGLIKDASGKKYYFDSSVCEQPSKLKLTSGTIVKFEINRKIKDVLCACKVMAMNSKEKTKHKQQIENLDKSFELVA